jgi:hypothetical protein
MTMDANHSTIDDHDHGHSTSFLPKRNSGSSQTVPKVAEKKSPGFAGIIAAIKEQKFLAAKM